ncbi:MAG TPA: LytTR family DNA-binding domain-containing protein [Chitinophagaceae bacterium]|nr:LytTR family DNA-binding domain-containing protein [Chitinophagaceae bacterium]
MPDTTTIRCLIIDDEPPAREIIRRYIEEVPYLELVGECGNALDALIRLQQTEVDLLFLDIRLPQLNGTDFLKTLRQPPKVIFTTAYQEYALEGYELDAVDYLLKPFRFDRFIKAINKAFQQSDHRTMPEQAPAREEHQQDSFVYFRADRKMVKVMLKDILYVESMKDYVKVVMTDGVLVTKQSITSVEAMLPEKLFIRSHRSFIVSLGRIRTFTNELIEVDKAEIPIGKLYRNSVLKMLG